MVMLSRYPDIEYPTDLTIWEWAFEDPKWSQLYKVPRDQISGYTNAHTSEKLDFAQVKELSTYLSTALVRNYGLEVDDAVSLFSSSTVWYPVAAFAVLRAGGRVNGASPLYTLPEMTHALNTAKAKFLMTVPSCIDVAIAAAKEAGIPQSRIFLLEGEVEGFTSMRELLDMGRSYGEHGQSAMFRVPSGKTNDICAFLNFSSGTTGLPKAVMLSHKNVIAQCIQLDSVTLIEKKRQIAALPLFHISGLIRFLMWPVASNDECILLPQFTMEGFLGAIEKHRITDATLVPTIIIRLLQDPVVDQYDISSLRRISSGAAPLSDDILERLRQKLPWVGFRQSYGMTESCCCLTSHPPEFYSYEYGRAAGVILASTSIKIIDVETGEELGLNETGEILARGPQIAMGYLENPQETSKTFLSDGYLRTGDIGKIDDLGLIYIVDRIKEMIKVKGQQVAPADLEQLLICHDSVLDCAVIGVPDDYSVERPKAYVVLKPGYVPSDSLGRELMQYVKDRRIRYKWVKEIEFLSEIPRNPSSKILRRILRSKDAPTGLVVTDHGYQAQSKL